MRQFVCLHCGHVVTQPRCNGVKGWQVRCDQCGGPVQRCERGGRMAGYRRAGSIVDREAQPERAEQQPPGETGQLASPAREQSASSVDGRGYRQAEVARGGRFAGGGNYAAGRGRQWFCGAAGAGRGYGRGGRCW
ncbi:MAG: hypothetical protein ACUVTU_12060 [Desulfurispora sp.]|uniref:hypothetical protein n=1 Tax=Desulfurispora sp. TaxID=3014275 RepID=UPI00404B29A3